jgi:hypothetical protein
MFVEKLWLYISIFHSENFVRYVFTIVLFVTLIARFLFYVVVVSCFSYVNHALNYPWFQVSAHVTKVALIFTGD